MLVWLCYGGCCGDGLVEGVEFECCHVDVSGRWNGVVACDGCCGWRCAKLLQQMCV